MTTWPHGYTHEHTPTGLPVKVLDDDGVTAELQPEGGGIFLAPSGEVAPAPEHIYDPEGE